MRDLSRSYRHTPPHGSRRVHSKLSAPSVALPARIAQSVSIEEHGRDIRGSNPFTFSARRRLLAGPRAPHVGDRRGVCRRDTVGRAGRGFATGCRGGVRLADQELRMHNYQARPLPNRRQSEREPGTTDPKRGYIDDNVIHCLGAHGNAAKDWSDGNANCDNDLWFFNF